MFRALLGRVVSELLPNTTPPDDRPSNDAADQDRQAEDLLNEERSVTGLATLAGLKLGRLNSKDYVDWDTFLRTALTKLSTSNPSSFLSNLDLEEVCRAYSSQKEEAVPTNLTARLACLHVIRGMVGPLIESLIIADRVLYIAEALEQTGTSCSSSLSSPSSLVEQTEAGSGIVKSESEVLAWKVSAANIFELESGSARNVALVVQPVYILDKSQI